MNFAHVKGRGRLAAKAATAIPGALIARTVNGTVAVPPREGAMLRFGRERSAEVELLLTADDSRVSRKQGMLLHRAGWWLLSNTGKATILISGQHRLHQEDDPIPMGSGYTTLVIPGTAERKHSVELYVVDSDGIPPIPMLGLKTIGPHTWPLTDVERLVLVILGQQYLLNEPHPQPLTRFQTAEQLAERTGEEWDEKRVDRVVERVRKTLSKNGVAGLTRDEVGEPVGNSLNHNLLTELTSGTLKPRDLGLLDDESAP